MESQLVFTDKERGKDERKDRKKGMEDMLEDFDNKNVGEIDFTAESSWHKT